MGTLFSVVHPSMHIHVGLRKCANIIYTTVYVQSNLKVVVLLYKMMEFDDL